jgi:hypothetical protein
MSGEAGCALAFAEHTHQPEALRRAEVARQAEDRVGVTLRRPRTISRIRRGCTPISLASRYGLILRGLMNSSRSTCREGIGARFLAGIQGSWRSYGSKSATAVRPNGAASGVTWSPGPRMAVQDPRPGIQAALVVAIEGEGGLGHLQYQLRTGWMRGEVVLLGDAPAPTHEERVLGPLTLPSPQRGEGSTAVVSGQRARGGVLLDPLPRPAQLEVLGFGFGIEPGIGYG